MKKRNPVAVCLLPFVTFGIYALVWYIKTKNEMNQGGAKLPSAIMLLIPFVNFYWIWLYSKSVESTTKGAYSAGTCFALLFFLGTIGQALVQSKFNAIATE